MELTGKGHKRAFWIIEMSDYLDALRFIWILPCPNCYSLSFKGCVLLYLIYNSIVKIVNPLIACITSC